MNKLTPEQAADINVAIDRAKESHPEIADQIEALWRPVVRAQTDEETTP
jgi:hypothetical protein